jgi:hypothetical protein
MVGVVEIMVPATEKIASITETTVEASNKMVNGTEIMVPVIEKIFSVTKTMVKIDCRANLNTINSLTWL